MSETVISWNFENIVTITLMAVIGFALLRIVFSLLGQYGALPAASA